MTEISMPPNPSLWRRATAAYAKLLEILLAACVGILVVPVTLQIISRYTPLIPSYIWTEEMARFLFVWTIMIGAMVGIRESQHFEVDVWPDLSRRSEAMVRILARLGVLAQERRAVGWVLGLPINMDGSEGPRAQSTRAFARNLSGKTNLPIVFWDERLSTSAVERELIGMDVSRAKRAEVIDEHAAIFILQGALDRLANLRTTSENG